MPTSRSEGYLKQLYCFCRPEPHKVDARSLAVFRILLSAFVLTDVYCRLCLGRLSLAWYTTTTTSQYDVGESSFFFPSILDRNDTPHGSPVHKLWFYRGGPQLQLFLFGWTVVAAVLFGVGYKTTWSSILLWLLVTSMQNRCMPINDGSDSFLRCILLWCTLLPLGTVWSVDATRSNKAREEEARSKKHYEAYTDRRHHDDDGSIGPILKRRHLAPSSTQPSMRPDSQSTIGSMNESSSEHVVSRKMPTYLLCSARKSSPTIKSAAALGLTLQIVFMYLGTVYRRIFNGSTWLPPKLTAVYYILNSSFAAREWASTFVRMYPQLSRAMTGGAMLVETLCPLACLLSSYEGRRRHIPATLLAFFHFNLLLSVRLNNWQFLGMICCVVWIPPHIWDHIPLLPTSTSHRCLEATKDNRVRRQSQAVTLEGDRRCAIPRVLLSWFFLVYMIYNWCGERQWISKHDGGNIGEFFRCSQYWVMYGPDPPTTSFGVYITGKILSEGEDERHWKMGKPRRVDVMKSIRTNDWGPASQLDHEAYWKMTHGYPTHMAARYPSWRWETCLNNWIKQKSKPRHISAAQRIERFARVLCREANIGIERDNNRQFGKESERTTIAVTHVEVAFRGLRVIDMEKTNAKQRFEHYSKDDFTFEVDCRQNKEP